MESLKEIQEFLILDAPQHLKSIATGYLLSLTGSKDGQELLFKSVETIMALGKLTEDKDSTVSKESLLCLVNLSANDDGGEVLLNTIPNLVEICVKNIKDPECRIADAWTMVLSNISRSPELAQKVFNELKGHIGELVNVFSRIDYNKHKCHLNYIGPILSNISQVAESRELFCITDSGLLNRLIPFVKYEDSIVRRGGIIGLIRNICFDTSLHSYLLEVFEILPVILYSLAGHEEFTEEANDKLPIELQFLGPDKKREDDPDIRRMLIDALAQLCATRNAREFLRSNGTYEILRELHKWENTDEGDKLCLIACENVVDILIRTEDEIGEDNLKAVDIPSDLIDKFNDLNSNLVGE